MYVIGKKVSMVENIASVGEPHGRQCRSFASVRADDGDLRGNKGRTRSVPTAGIILVGLSLGIQSRMFCVARR